MTGRPLRALFQFVVVGAALAVAAVTAANANGSELAAGSIVARDYNLGIRQFPQPGLSGKLSRMPIRLWGTIAGPASPGSHPVVLVAHGAHGDNCPGEYGTWPCYAREQRNDLGLRYLVQALARAGFVALAPDLNAAHTGGWGEMQNQEAIRFGQVVDATLAELRRAANGQATRFGAAFAGKADLTRLGVLGHSRGGLNVLAWARGKSAVASVFLLAPFFDPAQRIPDVPATVLLGTCDGDTGLEGAKYVTAAQSRTRTTPVHQLTLRGANHNFYNRTLVRLKSDDAPSGRPSCSRAKRPAPAAQQAFLARVARDHFAATMLELAQAPWMEGATGATQLYGQAVSVRRFTP